MYTTSVRRSSKSSVKSNGSKRPSGATGRSRGSPARTAGLLGRKLPRPFHAIRKKVSKAIGGNGQEYLRDAVNKITKTTSQMVKWSKKNPVKLAGGVAALTAVSAFLLHTMNKE